MGDDGRRWARDGRAILLALAVAVALGAVGIVLRGHPDPDRLWSTSEAAFLAGRWDEARRGSGGSIGCGPGPPWTGCCGLSSPPRRAISTRRWPSSIASPTSTRWPPRPACWPGGSSGNESGSGGPRPNSDALAIRPGLIEAHRELIYILGIQSRRREVNAEFRALARLTSLSHHDLFTWALTHFSQWSADIVEDLGEFIAADPEDRYSRLALAELLLEGPDAGVSAAKVLEPLPESDPDALAIRVELAFRLGRLDDAERLLALAPEGHPRIARIRGELAMRRRDLAAAIRCFREALGAEPYDRVSPMQLAQALRLTGDAASAESYEARVRRLNRVYNLIVRIRSPGRANRVSDLAELGAPARRPGWPTRPEAGTTSRSPPIRSTARPSRDCDA